MRLAAVLPAVVVLGLAAPAGAGDFHSGASLVCSDCHVSHYSQSHAYTVGGTTIPLGAAGPYGHLLRNEANELCLSCHDNQSWAPDVFGQNGGTAMNRLAGGLNAAAGHIPNDTGYDDIDGHTLWSTDTAPGGTFNDPDGLECVDCHAQHGITSQYRNLLNRGAFTGKNVTYAVGTNDLTKDVFERSAAAYAEADVDYNEPNTTASAYGNWCGTCHTLFHGSGGSANMGGASGGDANLAFPWLRHPTADVNIGQNASFISSLTRFTGNTNRVKVMDSQGLWDGTAADNTVTPSCFSCHKSHGNKNSFGLIFMAGTGTVTEEGDGGIYKDLCRQCHSQGG
jgi:hypothetical protein